MIKSVSIIPQDDLHKDLGLEKATGIGFYIECGTKDTDDTKERVTEFGIFIECGIKDADEIYNLIKKMTDRRYSIKPEGREDDD